MTWNSTGVTVAGITNVYGSNASLLNVAYDVAIDNLFNVYVADGDNNRIQRWSAGKYVD
jgi:hypothetical protein